MIEELKEYIGASTTISYFITLICWKKLEMRIVVHHGSNSIDSPVDIRAFYAAGLPVKSVLLLLHWSRESICHSMWFILTASRKVKHFLLKI